MCLQLEILPSAFGVGHHCQEIISNSYLNISNYLCTVKLLIAVMKTRI